jgi:tagatose-1,6-bisphosphate aldolase
LLEPVIYDHVHYKDDLLRTVTLFTDKCDVLKLEYPGLEESSPEAEAAACARVSQLADVPWILLSRGMEFEKFKSALQISMDNGASGFAVGRAVWQEIKEFSLEKTGNWEQSLTQIEEFLTTTGTERMKELIEIVEQA